MPLRSTWSGATLLQVIDTDDFITIIELRSTWSGATLLQGQASSSRRGEVAPFHPLRV